MQSYLGAAPLLLEVLEAALLLEAERLVGLRDAGGGFPPPDFAKPIPAAIRVTAATAAPAITPTDTPPVSFWTDADFLTGLDAVV